VGGGSRIVPAVLNAAETRSPCFGIVFSRLSEHLPSSGINSLPSLAIGSIIVCVRAFPGTGVGFCVPHHEVGKPLQVVWNLPRWLMTMLTAVVILFGIFAIGLILLLIYKSTLNMHSDEQLFLDDANSHMQEEQTELLTKVNRLTIPVRVFSIGSGVFLLVMVAMLIYQKLNEVQ
jgi:hypothetical protein